MTQFPIDYPKSEHERVIGRYFKQFVNKRTPDESASESDQRNYSHFVICFVNRCGSNLLANALRSTKCFGLAGEYFNHPLVTRVASECGMRSLEGYAREIRFRRAAPNGAFGTKLGWAQLYYLTEEGIIPKVFSNTRFILIQRRDVLGQAISFSIASQTKVWNSQQQSQQAEYRFDPRDIVIRIHGIEQAYARFKEYFAVFGIEPITVFYEELEMDIENTVHRVIKELAIPGTERARMDLTEIPLRRQRGPLNEQIREKMLAYTKTQSLKALFPKAASASSD